MPASNTGTGPQATAVNLGSRESPGSQSMTGNGSRPVQGAKLRGSRRNRSAQFHQPDRSERAGEPGSSGSATDAEAGGSLLQQRLRHQGSYLNLVPEYTPRGPQATHRRNGFGSCSRLFDRHHGHVLGVTSDLGLLVLDESAIRAIQATRFQPATDASGNPVDWEGVVNVLFQLAG